MITKPEIRSKQTDSVRASRTGIQMLWFTKPKTGIKTANHKGW